MINTIKEFAVKYPKAVIVNYDIAGTFDDNSGRTYRTSTNHLEYFRKENGKYLKYPQIQPYLKLSEDVDYKLFILYNHKMFELEKIDVNYHIKREIEDIIAAKDGILTTGELADTYLKYRGDDITKSFTEFREIITTIQLGN